MKVPTPLKIELVHISGPLKGEIQEFTEPEISIGRHPSCQVIFPRDLTIVSRKHAKIIREGNRFKIIDQSTNGTLVNGKPVKEAFIRNGDVITFAQGGPKLSFLVAKTAPPIQPPPEPVIDPAEQETLHGNQIDMDHGSSPFQAPPKKSTFSQDFSGSTRPAVHPPQPQEDHGPRANMPVVIQFGPVIKSFKQLPVTMGTDPSCDFTIDCQSNPDIKLEISFHNGSYILKNLSGKSVVTVNGSLLHDTVALAANDIIVMGQNDVQMEFIGEGRFAEVLHAGSSDPSLSPGMPERPGENMANASGKGRSFFKKIFKS